MLENLTILYMIGSMASIVIHLISWNLLYKQDKLSNTILDTDPLTRLYEVCKVALLWFIAIPKETYFIILYIKSTYIKKKWEKESNEKVEKVSTEEEIDDLLNEIIDQK
jgi:hypothetical protein